MTIKIALWLLPVGFVLHDGEELLTMVDWIARHQEELDAMVVARSSAAAPRRERAVHTY
jgi:hypothetical protein